MGKAALRNLMAHKGRLALSLLAVVLSAGFVAGTLIFTDTLKALVRRPLRPDRERRRRLPSRHRRS